MRRPRTPSSRQNPVGGAQVAVNTTVVITVNDGPKTGVIPAGLVGDDVDDVIDALREADFEQRHQDRSQVLRTRMTRRTRC